MSLESPAAPASQRMKPSGPSSRDRGRVLRLFPTSLFVLAPYVCLILPIAILQGNPQLAVIFGLLGLALLGTLSAEAIFLPLRTRIARTVASDLVSNRVLRNVTIAVFVVSCISRITTILTGGGSLLAQLSGAQGSTLTSVATLFSAWNLFAVGLIIACYMREVCTRRAMWLSIAVLLAIELWAVLQTTITAPLLQFASATLLVALLLGFVRVRTVILAVLVILLAWPTLYTLRNSLRIELGASVDQSVSAFDRLRFDEQLTAVTQFEVPVSAGQSDAVQVLRYGLVPRVLDPDRPNVSSARLINRFLGGSDSSSYNFLSIGTLYFFYGPVGVVVYYFLAALLFCLIVSRAIRAGPLALCMMMLAASALLGWASTFPDAITGYIQALVSFLPILVVLLIFKKRAKRPRRSFDSIGDSSATRSHS